MEEYAQLTGFLALGVVFGIIPLIVPQLISPRYKGADTSQTYECGIDTYGTSWFRFSISYYMFALVFVAFEVDILYLFPVALVYDAFPWRGLVEITIFLAILSLAILYAWRKGVFNWRA